MSLDKVKSKMCMSEQRYREIIRPSDSESPEYFFTFVALVYRLLYPNKIFKTKYLACFWNFL